MKSRWYFGILVLTVVVFGVVFQQRTSTANQEIILKFTDVELSSDKAQNTISVVRQQLLGLGVYNIQVSETKDALKITYYSDANVANVKEALSEKNLLVLDYDTSNQNDKYPGFPSDDIAIGYNINIYEIQKHSNSGWDIDGKYIIELKPKSDRFFNPDTLAFSCHVDAKKKNGFDNVAFKINGAITIAIGSNSYSIPEVRAGPFA